MTRSTFTAALATAASIALAAPAAAAVPHTVQAGETLWSIAAANGMSPAAIAAANGISPYTRVVSGTTLQIPPAGSALTSAIPSAGAGSSGAAGDGDADADDSGQAAGTASAPVPQPLGAHTVLPGETLSSIAARSGVSVRQLAWMNGLSPTAQLISGTPLKLPTGAPGTSTSAVSSAQPTPVQQTPAARTVPQAAPYPSAVRTTSGQIGQIAAANGVPPSLAAAIGWQESGFNNSMVSSANARGVMQVMPGTWQWVQGHLASSPLDPNSANDNVRAGVLYLGQLLRDTGGDPAAATAAYYQGLGSVRAHGMLPETQRYVANVMALRSRFGGP